MLQARVWPRGSLGSEPVETLPRTAAGEASREKLFGELSESRAPRRGSSQPEVADFLGPMPRQELLASGRCSGTRADLRSFSEPPRGVVPSGDCQVLLRGSPTIEGRPHAPAPDSGGHRVNGAPRPA